jgi:hypothetical protein
MDRVLHHCPPMRLLRGQIQKNRPSIGRKQISPRALSIALSCALASYGIFSPPHAAASSSPELFGPCSPPSKPGHSSKFLLPAGSTLFSTSAESSLQELLKLGETALSTPDQGDELPYGIRLYTLNGEQTPDVSLYMGRIDGVSPRAKLAAWKARDAYGGQIEAGKLKLNASALKIVDPTEADKIGNTQYHVRAHQSFQAIEVPLRKQSQIGLRLGVDAQGALDHGMPVGSAIPNASIEWSRPLGKYSELRLEAYTGVRSPEVSLYGFQSAAPPLEVGARASLLQF